MTPLQRLCAAAFWLGFADRASGAGFAHPEWPLRLRSFYMRGYVSAAYRFCRLGGLG
jgi:hypothetical protein